MEVPGRKKDGDAAAGSQSFYELTCEPCNREEGKHLKAVAYCIGCEDFFCQACVKSHKRFGSKDHVLLEGDKMPKTKPAKRKGRADNQQEECTDICDKHRGELVKYYCQDHKVVGCMDCVTLGHKSCSEIQLISEISRQKQANQLFESFRIRLEGLTTTINRFIKESDVNKEEADKQYQVALSNLRKYKSEIVETLNALEKVIEKEARVQKEANMKAIAEISVSCKIISKNISGVEAEFDVLKNGSRKPQLFTLVHRARSQLEEWERQSRVLEMKNKIQKYTFEPQCLLRDMLQNPEGLGKLVRHQDENKQTREVSSKSKVPTVNKGQIQDAQSIPDRHKATRMQSEDVSVRNNDPQGKKGQSRWPCPKCSSASQNVKLACGHVLYPDCAGRQMNNNRPCSECGVITGSQPQGSLNTSSYGAVVNKMTFQFPDGIQMPHHPQPGQQYRGGTLVCYLEKDDKGWSISKLLQIAFDRRLIGRLQDGTVCDNVGLFDMAPWPMKYGNWLKDYHKWIPRITKRLADLGIRA